MPRSRGLVSGGKRTSFRELHGRVGRMAATLREHGFGVGDRLAILLPNEPDYDRNMGYGAHQSDLAY
jgi:long-chain acyl-CoA synthetase